MKEFRHLALGSVCIVWALAGLSAADDWLIIMDEKGALVVAEASPSGYKELARAKVFGSQCWTSPVLSDGRVYCRNFSGDLVCLDVKGE